ncbi:transglutaminase-like domain-containing protein [Aquirufa aurantiipilula]|uniref:Transglutaminase-like domain-containing protein n=1 Tax=Aquirufa aurantiipilula TaxID=2696561 RepID=A0ABT6BL48_9BACT|nr:transglutaminase-like domain-containing protein [Aquirufa aurantiipilula]MDF5691202.1 transglutaminase-like domain-containing protein [Aquirufa aurantiipilula]
MKEPAIKAMIQLLDDSDSEVVQLVEQQIRTLGPSIIPVLESEWEQLSLNPFLQEKIENLIHDFQLESMRNRLAIWKEAGGMDLMEGMWIVATYRFPDYSFSQLKTELDQLYYEVWPQIRENLHPMDQIKVLNGVIFDQLKFGANTKNFHAANNSYINVVLESKKGNPISLCVIYMWIAQRLGFPVYGVNLPNLFVLTYKQKGVQFYINVFNKGLIFNRVDIDNYLAQLNLAPNEIYYNPCSNLEIIRRVLRNLIMAYDKAGDEEHKNELSQIIDSLD